MDRHFGPGPCVFYCNASTYATIDSISTAFTRLKEMDERWIDHLPNSLNYEASPKSSNAVRVWYDL